MRRTVESYSREETEELGRSLSGSVQPGDIIALQGELGTGKTVFVKGFAKGLGIGEIVSSPTFTILQEYYDGRLPLFHFDVYRIDDPDEMDELGYEEYFFGDGVTVVEWPSRIAELLPENIKKVVLEKDLSKGADYRKITLENWDE